MKTKLGNIFSVILVSVIFVLFVEIVVLTVEGLVHKKENKIFAEMLQNIPWRSTIQFHGSNGTVETVFVDKDDYGNKVFCTNGERIVLSNLGSEMRFDYYQGVVKAMFMEKFTKEKFTIKSPQLSDREYKLLLLRMR